jgi:hypothetical protein
MLRTLVCHVHSSSSRQLTARRRCPFSELRVESHELFHRTTLLGQVGDLPSKIKNWIAIATALIPILAVVAVVVGIVPVTAAIAASAIPFSSSAVVVAPAIAGVVVVVVAVAVTTHDGCGSN